MRGKSYKQWFKEVENHILKRGYSIEYANAITCCVRSYYYNKYNYMNPAIAANTGLYPRPYLISK